MDIRIILVRPLYETNVGAVSRVMSNTGCKHLILIAPECELTFAAQQAAATGQQALQTRRTYCSWEEFYQSEPDGVRIALTARDGRSRSVQHLDQTLRSHEERLQNSPVYLMFGPEHWGLSNADIDHAHFACSLPVFGENPSYNLSHAVLLACFIARSTLNATVSEVLNNTQGTGTPFPEETVRTWLSTLGFDVERTGVNVLTVLKRLLLHSVPTRKETRVLEVVLHQSIRKMREYDWMRRQVGHLPKVEIAKKVESDLNPNYR